MAWLRRLIWLFLLAGGGVLAYSLWQRRPRAELAEPEWPPFAPVAAPTPTTAVAVAADEPPGALAAALDAAGAGSAEWLAPIDGACPEGYPVKASERSGIYHLPGGRFYDRTKPDRCYTTAAAAEADGYRASKS